MTFALGWRTDIERIGRMGSYHKTTYDNRTRRRGGETDEPLCKNMTKIFLKPYGINRLPNNVHRGNLFLYMAVEESCCG